MDSLTDWLARFDDVRYGDAMAERGLRILETDLGNLVGDPALALPELLRELLKSGVAACGNYGWLGTDAVGYYDAYEFELYMPGAVPIALDGGGGFLILDGRTPDTSAVHWVHVGNLGWDAIRVVAPTFSALTQPS